jgi:AcrR family transcriptional regulator
MKKTAPEKPESPLVPRKLPTQQRARHTVESILQATEELVRVHGFGEVNTRLIAERAGISIGSLYQYFPTYESILLAWYEEVAGRAAYKIKVATVEILGRDLRESLMYAIRQLLDVYEEHELVLIRMVREVGPIAHATAHTSFECMNRGSMRIFFSQHHEFDPKHTERHVFLIENIITSNLHRYLLERPRYLSRKELLSNLCRVVQAYLEGCAAKGA